MDPAADLMSMFSHSYLREHRTVQYRQMSYAGGINRRVLDKLYDTLAEEPEVNLLSAFPKSYSRRINMATGSRPVKNIEPKTELIGPPEFRTRLELAETATVVYPLSEDVDALIARYSSPSSSLDKDNAQDQLVLSLKQLLWDSPKLWESYVRGVVVKCNENIVAKVLTGNEDYTEYTSMQYLMRQAPDIPAPRPHGLIAFEPFRVLFMSYIPGTTLTHAWPGLSHEDKLSIQRQLDGIFRRLRILRPEQDDNGSTMLGGVCGEGAKELRVDECALFKDITTTKQFDDLQFSARHHGSTTYVQLLRSLLAYDTSTLMDGPVFTHGDIRTDNIMVQQQRQQDQDPDSSGDYVVTGVIDWEDSGFYPPYYECTVLTRTLSLVNENDWYLYLPESVSPAKFPVRWLVDRLWQIHLKTT